MDPFLQSQLQMKSQQNDYKFELERGSVEKHKNINKRPSERSSTKQNNVFSQLLNRLDRLKENLDIEDDTSRNDPLDIQMINNTFGDAGHKDSDMVDREMFEDSEDLTFQ